jgi:ankyrin repeat protein
VSAPGAWDVLIQAAKLGMDPFQVGHFIQSPEAVQFLDASLANGHLNAADLKKMNTAIAQGTDEQTYYSLGTLQGLPAAPELISWALAHGATPQQMIRDSMLLPTGMVGENCGQDGVSPLLKINPTGLANITAIEQITHYGFNGSDFETAANHQCSIDYLTFIADHEVTNSGPVASCTFNVAVTETNSALSIALGTYLYRQGSSIKPLNSSRMIKDLIALEPDLSATFLGCADAGDRSTFLSTAAQSYYPLAVQMLIDAGAPVDESVIYNGVTADALYVAITVQSADAAAILAKNAKDAAKTYSNGQNALTLALNYKQAPVVEALLESGQFSNQKNDQGTTALMVAASLADTPALAAVLKNSSTQLEATDQQKRTALFYAIQSGSVGNVQQLLQKGANANVTDANGITPMALAQQGGNDVIITLVEIALLPPQPAPWPMPSASPSPSPSLTGN